MEDDDAVIRDQMRNQIMMKVTGFLSMIGSAYVMYEILSDKRKKHRTYFKLMFGMQFIEFFDGLAFFLGSWAVYPTGYWWQAKGTYGSCMFQAFLLQMSVGSALYNASLAIYYLLSIHYNWSERKIQIKVEPWLHSITLLWAFGTALASYFLNIFGSMGMVCYISRYPPTCKETYIYGYTDCEFGDNSSLYSKIFFEVPLWFCVFITALCMIIIFLGVRKQEKRNAQYDFSNKKNSSNFDNSSNNRSSRFFNRDGTNKKNICRKYSRRFAVQGLLYVLVFYLTHFFSSTAIIIYQATGNWTPAFTEPSDFFIPLEGFLNFLVYMRPRFLNWREKERKRKTASQRTNTIDRGTQNNSSHLSGSTLTNNAAPKKQPNEEKVEASEKQDNVEILNIIPAGPIDDNKIMNNNTNNEQFADESDLSAELKLDENLQIELGEY